MNKEAKRLAKISLEKYAERKTMMEGSSEQDIIISMMFDKDNLSKLPEQSRKRIETCCKTVNGFCYMIALDTGVFKGLPNFRSLQFTKYMDNELEANGFPKQSFQQKKEILEAMELAIDGWEKLTNDKNY